MIQTIKHYRPHLKITSFIYLLATVALHAQDVPVGVHFADSSMSWEDILQQAKKEDKYVFLDCFASWCVPCKLMDKEVFSQEVTGRFMNTKFVNVRFDMEKGEGKVLRERYKEYIPAYPSFLLIDSNGIVIYQSTGFQEPAKLLADLKEGLKGHSWPSLSLRYEQGERNWSFMNIYFGNLRKNYQFGRMHQLMEESKKRLSIDDIERDTAAFEFFVQYWDDAEAPIFRQFVRQDVRISSLHHLSNQEMENMEKRVFSKTVDRYYQLLREAPETYSSSKADTLIEDLLISRAAGRSDLITQMRFNQAVYMKDYPQFLSLLQAIRSLGLLRYKNGSLVFYLQTMLPDCEDHNELNKLSDFVDWLSNTPGVSINETQELKRAINTKLNKN